jgi:hypothetical protein
VPDFPAVQVPGVYRRRIGDIIVTAVSDGYLIMDREMTRNLPRHELMQALSAAFREELVFSVNTFLVQSAGRTVLIDTGSGDYLGPTTPACPPRTSMRFCSPICIPTTRPA